MINSIGWILSQDTVELDFEILLDGYCHRVLLS